MLHQVGVLFDLYYDARKHKSKKDSLCLFFYNVSWLTFDNIISLAGIRVLMKVIAVDISFNIEKQKCTVLIYDFDCLVFFDF